MLVYANSGSTIHLGRVGENLATEVVFNISKWFNEYGKGAAELVVQKDGETYPQLSKTVLHYQPLLEEPDDWKTSWLNYYEKDEDSYISLEGDKAPVWEDNKYYSVDKAEVIWQVTNSNTTNAGIGKCELFYFKNEVLVKSAIYDTIVTNALGYDEGAEPPAPYTDWVENVLETAAKLEDGLAKVDEAVETARCWAIGPNNTEVPEIPTEENNAWYYSTQSANSAAAAEVWAEGEPEGDEKSAKDWAVGLNEETDDYSSRYHASLAESWSNKAADSATESGNKAQESKDSALLSRQWAVGLTDDSEIPTDENNAKAYAYNAAGSATLASQKAGEAANSAGEAASSAGAASDSKEAAQSIHDQTVLLKDAAEGAASAAGSAREAAESSAELAKNWAIGPADTSEVPTESNNAKYYAELAVNVSEHPPRIGLLEEGEDPDYWYVWNRTLNRYDQTNSKVRFSIVAVYPSVEDMEKSTHEVGDFVIVSDPLDSSDAILYVYDGGNWSKVTDLSGYEGIGIATIKYTGNNLGDTVGTTPYQPGAVDNYLITYTNGRTQPYSVYNGTDGNSIKGVKQTSGDHSEGTVDVYAIEYTKQEPTIFEIYNGADGNDGYTPQKGIDYNDGISPTIEVQDTTNGHIVIITDINGSSTFEILNGTGAGDMISASYDPTGEVIKAGGIEEYVKKSNEEKICLKIWTAGDLIN